MTRQYIRLLRLLPVIALVPIIWTAHSTFSFESYLNTLSIRLSDFPRAYADTLTRAVNNNDKTFDFDYSIFHHDAKETNQSTPSDAIPSIIHFIWYHDLYNTTSANTAHSNPIPHSGSHAPARCRLFNPEYDIRIWNATAGESFLEEHYPWILPTYHGYPYPIQRVDLLKYFLLYHYGGIYMDLDIACRRPMEPLLEFPAWFPKASPLGVNNDLMAARKGHPLLKYMIERLQARNRWLGSEWVTVFWSTGPRFASDMIWEWFDAHSGDRYLRGAKKSVDANPDGFFILPEQFYSQDPGYTFFGHSPGGTWYGEDAQFVVWLLDRPWIIAIIIGTPIALAVGMKIRKRRALGMKTAKF